jgi:molecular chaperone GrpE (heat shock protein)
MAPVEEVREPLRKRLRHEFVRSHAQEIESLRRSLLPTIRNLERRFALPAAFPTV